jgi:hypothetical protein
MYAHFVILSAFGISSHGLNNRGFLVPWIIGFRLLRSLTHCLWGNLLLVEPRLITFYKGLLLGKHCGLISIYYTLLQPSTRCYLSLNVKKIPGNLTLLVKKYLFTAIKAV